MSLLTPQERAYRSDIDGLRAIAIVSTVVFHAGLSWMTGGFTGVDIFFVISGYLIGGHIYAELRKGTFSFADFYQRRAKRILPAYFAVLLFTILAALVLLSPYEAMLFGRSAFAATLSTSNILFWKTSGYFDLHSDYNPLLMTWSLGVEEQFYAVVPILLLVVYRFRRNLLLPFLVLTCVVSLAFAAYELPRHPTMVFYMLPSRAWELCAGVLLAVVEKGRRLSLSSRSANLLGWAALAMLIVPIVLLSTATPFPGFAAMPSVAGATILLATPQGWINRRVLSTAPMVYIGKVSYSFYLWHWPLLALARVVFGPKLPPLLVALLIATAFGAAVLSYYLVEQPFRKSKMPPVPLLIRYGVVTAVLLVVCTVVWKSGGLPQRDQQLARMEHEGLSLQDDPCLEPYGKEIPNTSSTCMTANNSKAVALWGDSHAAALAQAMRKIALSEGYDLIRLNKASCLPLEGVTRSLPAHPGLAGECLRFNQRALQVLKDDARIKFVVMTGYWSAPFQDNTYEGPLVQTTAEVHSNRNMDAASALLSHALVATIQSVQAMGKQVILLDDVPSFATDPLWRVRTARSVSRYQLTNWLGMKNGSDPGLADQGDLPAAEREGGVLAQVRRDCPGVRFINLKQSLCNTEGECFYRRGELLLYSDNQHLSESGALYALRDFHLPSAINFSGTPKATVTPVS